MYLLKKPRMLSPSIPKRLLDFKGKKLKGSRTLKNNEEESSCSSTSEEWRDMEDTVIGFSNDHESIRKSGAGTSDEWTDLASTIMDSSTVRSSLDQIAIASSRWLQDIDLDSFENFNPGEPLASSTPCSTKSSFFGDRRGSSSDCSTVEQARFADSFKCDYGAPLAAPPTYSRKSSFAEDIKDSFEFNFGAPAATSTPCSPNSSFVKDRRELLPEGAKYWNSFERSFEKEYSMRSCATKKAPESSFVEDKRYLEDFACFQFEEPSATVSHLYKKASFLKQDNNVLSPEAPRNRNSFERSFEKDSSKSSCPTQKEIHSAKIPERRTKLKRWKPYSGCRLIDKKPKISQPTSKQESEIEPTKNVLSRCDENICPLRIDLVPGPERSPSPLFFRGDAPSVLLPEASTYRSFEGRFEKESSKSSCATHKEMYPAKIPERRIRFKKRKLYSEDIIVDKKLKRSKRTKKQASEVEPTKNVLSRCDGNICPLGLNLVPGPKRSPSPLFFRSDVPIDDIYYLINGRKLQSKKMRTKCSRENKSRKK